jgi:predicted aspartyl protease
MVGSGRSGSWRGVLAVALAATFSPLVQAGPGEATSIPFREAWGWAVIVPVEVAGAGVHEFLLDTGASFTILDPELAAEAGVSISPTQTILTLVGERRAEAARVDLALGPFALRGMEVRIAALPAIRSDQPTVRGLLGQSVLKHLEYTIDHARRRLVVHRAETVAASPGSARPVLQADLGCGGAASRFVLDSGIERPVLFEEGGHRVHLDMRRPVKATTNGGTAVWQEGLAPSLCVAGRQTGPLPVVVRPRAEIPREETGLLPSRFFARVRIGPAGAVMAVDFW